MNSKERARRIKSDIPAVFLALKHSKTPLYVKILAGITIGYALSPVDLIPDFIPVFGYLDDLILLPALIVLTVKRIPSETMEECRQNAKELWRDGKPKRWYYAIPVIIVWLVWIGFIIKWIWF